MSAGTYYVYILASRKYGTLYIGITNDLRTRLEQHRSGRGSEFVKKLWRAPPRPRGDVRIAAGSNRTRKAVEELAPRLEDTADRRR
jgi:hypothetical protein